MQPPNMKVQQEAEIKCFNKHIAQNNEQDMNYSQSQRPIKIPSSSGGCQWGNPRTEGVLLR